MGCHGDDEKCEASHDEEWTKELRSDATDKFKYTQRLIGEEGEGRQKRILRELEDVEHPLFHQPLSVIGNQVLSKVMVMDPITRNMIVHTRSEEKLVEHQRRR